MKPIQNIVHLISSFKGGGLEHFVVRLAQDQIRIGHAVRIVALHEGPLLQQALDSGIDAHILGNHSKIGRILQCARLFRKGAANIIHAHNPTVLHYAAIGKVVSGAKLVMTDHAQTRGIARVPSLIERRLTDRIVAVSAHTAKASYQIGFTGEIEVIHNGVDVKPAVISRETVRQNLGLDDDMPVVLNAAGLLPVKAQDTLIQAIARLRDQNIRVMLLIAGEGPERENLVKCCRDMNLDDNWVRLLGFRTDIPDLLNASDMFALVSRNEGLPISVLEAMSHGLPVVATPAGGVEELVRHGRHGLIVPFDDPSELAESIKKFVMDPALRKAYGEEGRQHALDNFSFRTTSQKYMELYSSLAK